MSTVLLDQHHSARDASYRVKDGATGGAYQKLKRSFFASLAIHAGFLLALVVVSSMPHKFHFEQTTLIELQGISAATGNTGAGNSAVAKPAPAVQQPREIKSAAAPKVATLKANAIISQTAPKTEAAPEKISLKSSKKSSEKMREPQVNLKERILQKFQQIPRIATSTAANADTASSGRAGPKNVREVAGIGTDVPFPFAGYLAGVRDRIADLWEEPSLISSVARGAQAVVVFRIQHDGSVVKVFLSIPSGISALDKSALRAVESANPLPPLPPEFKDSFLDVHLQFDLTR